MKKYRFTGQGLGVPGLPHEISEEQAKAEGMQKLLQAAIENGLYEEVKEHKPKAPKREQAFEAAEKGE